MDPSDIESSLLLRISLRRAADEHPTSKKSAVSEDPEAYAGGIELLAQEGLEKGVRKEGVIRAGPHSHATSHLWSLGAAAELSVDTASFEYTPAELAVAGTMMAAELQARRSYKMALLEAPILGSSQL